jgi:hypothetical protein
MRSFVMELRKFLIIIAVTLIIALILAVWFFPSNDDFRVDNPFWNGLVDIQAKYDIKSLGALSELPATPHGTTLLVIPYLEFNSTELWQLNRFVSRGGRLIIADDYGHGNQILTYLGLQARFSGEVLLDPLVNANKYFPKVHHLLPDPLTANTGNLVLNHATSLNNITGDTAIALSSPFSFLDYNGDGTREVEEPAGPLPVISRHRLNQGELILVSDPSLLINGMNTIEDNDSFIRNIATTSSAVYIDQSHLPFSELHHTRSWLQQARRLLCTPAGTAVLVLAVILLTLIPIWYRKDNINTVT